MLLNALQTHALLAAHAQKESALETETQEMMIWELVQPLSTVVTAAELMVGTSVHSEAAAMEWAQAEEAAKEVVLEDTAVVVAAADVEVDPEVEVVVAAASVQAVVVVMESPKTSIHADDNHK